MSFEQLDIERREDDKNKRNKEKQKALEFQLEKKILRESSDLLQKLASEISKEFGIDISKVRELISQSTSSGLEGLKSSINSDSQIDIPALSRAISGAKKQIEDMSKSHRESLKNSLHQRDFTPEAYEYKVSQNYIPESLRLKAQNPQGVFDQALGAGLGIIDTTEAVITFTYFLGKGILLTPYHIYLVLTGEKKYNGISKI